MVRVLPGMLTTSNLYPTLALPPSRPQDQPLAHKLVRPFLGPGLARRLKAEGGVGKEDEITLPSITKVAQEVMTSDLEHLINLVVDPSEADYAVVTGIQVHSWGDSYHDLHPNLEYVQPCSLYVVNQGKRTDIDIQTIAGPTPRQLRLLNAPQLKRSEIDLSIRPDSPHVHTMTRRRESASRTSSFSRAFRV
mmetsp:Transcript_65299/g.206269  ORF Transcript_65299/g.206269 Transcript_65299/m.206269 type:complete len:192 (-) Transcript_65299:323-898(-)